MGTHSDAVRLGQPHHRSHVVEIGSMETARHVRDVNQGHKARVVPHPVEPERFAHITIDRSHVPSVGSVRESCTNLNMLQIENALPTEHPIKRSWSPSHRSCNIPRKTDAGLRIIHSAPRRLVPANPTRP